MTVNRLSMTLLNAALILSAIAAIVFAVRIILEQMLSIGTWYWGGALAVFSAPLLIAASMRLLDGRASTGKHFDS